MSDSIRKTFEQGNGIFRMVPNFIPVKFGVPGRRLKIHPDDYFAYGADSGTIMERWFCALSLIHILEINGHDYDQIADALDLRKKEKPVCVIADTIKGKGLSCAENKAGWHHKTPSLEQVEQFRADMAELRKELM